MAIGDVHKKKRASPLLQRVRVDPSPPNILAAKVTATLEKMSKLTLLLDEWGISKDDPQKWLALSLALAIKYDPAFRETASSRGRPAKWTAAVRRELIRAIDAELLGSKRRQIRGAIRALLVESRRNESLRNFPASNPSNNEELDAAILVWNNVYLDTKRKMRRTH